MGKNYISELEYAEINLEDDIQALNYLVDECFAFSKPSENFKYSYFEIQNRLNLMLKSMMYNHGEIKKEIDNYYKKEREEK